jgi:hypothetical protein
MMATEVPWTGSEFDQLLEQKLGSDWAEQFETKWGSEWGQPCAEELTGELGDNWADNPENATDTLVELVSGDAATTESDSGLVDGGADAVDPDGEPDVDLSRYGWLKTFTEANSFESWLVRIGVSTQDANTIVNTDKHQSAEEGSR